VHGVRARVDARAVAHAPRSRADRSARARSALLVHGAAHPAGAAVHWIRLGVHARAAAANEAHRARDVFDDVGLRNGVGRGVGLHNHVRAQASVITKTSVR
jgi:hypothetical protein